eukprot:Tamp_16681.p2 GENE.Tamp_16681~~Tamp_16681.p2  ORF type:complete len:365 (-),score=68.78 Tamp_16681:348-1406(-)
MAAQGTWYFDEHGSWRPFDPTGQDEVERAYTSNQKTVQSTFFNPRLGQPIAYKYDLVKMQQVNTTTGFVRSIKRELNPDAAGLAPHHPAAHLQGPAHAPQHPHGQHKHQAQKKARGDAHDTVLEYKAPGDAPAGAAGGADADFATVTAFETVPASDLGGDDECCICMESFRDDHGEPCIKLSKCTGHYFHRSCIDNPGCFKQGWLKCPLCKATYGVQLGPQPSGTMTIHHAAHLHCDGHQDCGTWQIQYNFPGGTQTASMPNPGKTYEGTGRTAYIPDNDAGRQVLELLKTAFQRGLTFQVGTSVTTGRENTTVWNGIHHKTNLSGGSSHFGYPDHEYFGRVKDELEQKGVC